MAALVAAQFAISKATIDTPHDGKLSGVAVQLRKNVLRIKQRGVTEPIVVDESVTLAERAGRKEWTVTSAQGVYRITKEPCNCGGRS